MRLWIVFLTIISVPANAQTPILARVLSSCGTASYAAGSPAASHNPVLARVFLSYGAAGYKAGANAALTVDTMGVLCRE